MRQAVIQHAQHRDRAHHAGLLLDCFLAEPATGPAGKPDERRKLLHAAIAASRSQTTFELYSRAYARWRASLPSAPETPGAASNPRADVVLQTKGRLIVGLGQESVLETGIRLHHTYGVPTLPGSGLKGLAAHYCDCVWGQQNLAEQAAEENKLFRRGGLYHTLLFGTTEEAGAIRFEDGWMLPESLRAAGEGLQLDVMTPHHLEWQTSPLAAPTDFDSPIPVAFLSVAGRFHVALSWQGPESLEADKWIRLSMLLLQEAAREWGAGGKTSSGYGRLSENKRTSEGTAQQSGIEQKPASSPVVASAVPTRRPTGTAVRVKVLERHSAGGPAAFWVQEEGRKRGLLALGTPPSVLPELNTEINVFINSDDPRAPQYRWDSGQAPGGGGRKGPPPRGKR